MEDKEEMIELGDGRVISKTNYQNALNEFYKNNKINTAPLTYDGNVIGRVYSPEGDTTSMSIEILTGEGKKLINGILNQPIGVSSRKTGTILENNLIKESDTIEFSILNMENKFEEKLKVGYTEYLKLPLASLRNKTEIYLNQWCVIVGKGVVSPDPHRYYTFLEFVYWCGKNETLYERFIK